MSTTTPFSMIHVNPNNDVNTSCDNAQSNKFTSYNSLMYDPCSSEQKYKENIKHSEYQLGGATCNADGICKEGNCGGETLVKEHDIHKQFKKETQDSSFYQDTRGYSTYGQTPQFFNDKNELVNKDNALKRSCFTNLNYINQYQAKNVLANNDNYDQIKENANKEMGASTSFGAPIPNMERYRPDNNYLNKDTDIYDVNLSGRYY